MRKYALMTLLSLILAAAAFAQQDPGQPDSLILGSVHVDSGAVFAMLPIWAVTDDSVGFYNTPLAWHAPLGGVRPGTGTLYFPPINSWEFKYDTIMFAESYIRMFGIYSLGDTLVPPLLTNGQRRQIITLRFIIDSGTPSQLVVIDTTTDPRNGSLQYGLVDGITGFTPRFQRGFISIGSVGTDDPIAPGSFALSQNYPNPFNPSTNIAFSLPVEGKAFLVIYDLLGREVRTLLDDRLGSGSYSLVWNGRDNNNHDVPSGTYFYRLTTEGSADTKRMTLIR